MNHNRRILAVSFGTSFPGAREAAIGGIERALSEAFSGETVYRCFTSGMVIRHIKESEGILVDDPKEALERAVRDGVKELWIQPTHVMGGAEYQKFMKVLDPYRNRFETVKTGKPLLTDKADFEALADALQQEMSKYADASTAVVLAGHGSETEADQVYQVFQAELRARGCRNCYVGTIESRPGIGEILEVVKKDPDIRRIVLVPFMVVAGDHAANDIAGAEHSWKSTLEEAGYEVIPVLKGMGEYPAVQELYVQHLKQAVC